MKRGMEERKGGRVREQKREGDEGRRGSEEERQGV